VSACEALGVARAKRKLHTVDRKSGFFLDPASWPVFLPSTDVHPVNRGDCENCDNTFGEGGEMLMRPQGYSSEGGTCTIVPPFEERSEPLVTSRDGVKCLVVQHAVFGGSGWGGWGSRLVL
jgi:hypothetical protein